MKKVLLLLTIVFGLNLGNSQIFWQSYPTSFTTASRGVSEISFADANTVWINSYDGANTANTIREWGKSTDSGVTWTNGIINLGASSTNLGIGSIEGIDANTAFVAAYPLAGGVTGGVWKTVDGGATWTRQNTATFTGADAFTNFVTFWDANEGLCQGDPNGGYFEIYRTLDGGTTWTRVPSANIPAPQAGEYGYVRNYSVVGDIIWFGTNQGRIYKSLDRGVNWTVAQSPVSDFGSAAVNANYDFEDANTGILVSNSYEYFTTSDGGTSWTPLAATGTLRDNSICYVPGVTGALIQLGEDLDFAERGSSYSLDGGLTWEDINVLGDDLNVNNPSAVEFFDANTGLASGFTTSSVENGIFKYVGTVLANDTFDAAQFVASPNPTTGLFNIAGQNITNIVVTDVLGKTVLNQNYTTLNNVSLDLTSFNSGLYLVKVTNDNKETATLKVVKN